MIDKAWFWRNDNRIVNGVHIYGRRRAPYGTFNYPQEIEKIRQMTANRDQAVWAVAQGKKFDLKSADAGTRPLDPVPAPDEAAVLAEHLDVIGEGTHFYRSREAMYYPAPVADAVLERLIAEGKVQREVTANRGTLLYRL